MSIFLSLLFFKILYREVCIFLYPKRTKMRLVVGFRPQTWEMKWMPKPNWEILRTSL